MSCGCGCGSSCGKPSGSTLLGRLGLLGVLTTGSRVRVGFPFEYSHAYDPDEIAPQVVSYIQNALSNYLNDGVTFSNVRVSVNPPGYFSDGYITVEAETRTDLPTANVFGDMVEYGIATYLPRILTTRRDETLIDYAAPGRVGQQGVEVAGPPRVCDWNTMDFRNWVDCNLGMGAWSTTPQTSPGSTPNPNQAPTAPGACNWDAMTFGNYVACQLGIDSAIGGVKAGAMGALLAVGGISLAAILLLRR